MRRVIRWCVSTGEKAGAHAVIRCAVAMPRPNWLSGVRCLRISKWRWSPWIIHMGALFCSSACFRTLPSPQWSQFYLQGGKVSVYVPAGRAKPVKIVDLAERPEGRWRTGARTGDIRSAHWPEASESGRAQDSVRAKGDG